MNKLKLALLIGALLVLLGSGLAYGGMVPWAMALIGVATGALLVIWITLGLLGIVASEINPRHFVWHVLAVAAVIAWALIQVFLPLPLDLAHPGWEAMSNLIAGIDSGTISVDPSQGLNAIMNLLVYLGMFWIFAQLTRNPERANIAFNAICFIGTTIALIGLVNHLNGPRMLPWLPDQKEVVRSTFINRNNFATYCGFTVIVSLALLFQTQNTARRETGRTSSTLKQFGRTMVTGGSLYLTAIIVTFMALVLSGSRAGMAATMLGIATLLALNWFTERKGRRGLGALAPILLVVTFSTLAVAGDFLTARLLAEDFANNERFLAYLDVVSAIQDYPLTGIGYGAFAQAYPVYRSDDVLHVRFFAENTYLEMIFELGIPIALVWFATLGALARRCFTGALQRQRHKVFPMAAAAVSVLAAAHAMLDFSLQITAVALLFAAIIGTGVAQSWPTRSR